MRTIKLTLLFMLIHSFMKLYPDNIEIKHIQSASEYDYPPFCIVNEDSTPGGFSVDLLKESCEAVGIDVGFKIDEWNIIKQELEDGKLDVLPLVGRTPERENIYDFTFPYLTFHGAVFIRKGDKRIKDIQDLRKLSIMVLKGDNAEEYAVRTNISSEIITASTYEEAFKALETGECDAVISQKVMGLQLINKLELKNIVPSNIKLEGFQQDFCFAVKEGNSKLLAILNEGLSTVIADGTFERLQKKWFSPIDNFKQTRLIVGGDKDYPPFEFIDEKGNPAGYNIDLIKAIAKNLGILIEIKLGKWSEIRKELNEGEIDVVSGMYFTAERDKEYEFSTPHFITDHVIITREGSYTINELSELKGKKILVMESDVMHDYLLNNNFDKEIKTVASLEEVLLTLSGGQYDCALVAKIPAQYYIEKDKLHNLIISRQSFLPNEYCFAAKEGDEELIGAIYNALTEIKASGEYKKIYDRWLGKYNEPEINFIVIIKYFLVVIIPLFLLLLGVMLWSNSLQKQVHLKTKELSDEIETRKYSEELLYGLFDNMPSGSAIYEVMNNGEKGSDYIIKYFNKKSLEIENKKIEDVIGRSLFDLRPNIDEYGLVPIMKKVWLSSKPEFFPAKVYIDENYSNYYENNIFKLPTGEIVTIYNDVTERMRNELLINEKINELNKNKEAMLNLLNDLKEENILRKSAEEGLRCLNEELEQRIKERTNELEIAKNELETFNYSISHDLKAPLRAISGFSKILKSDHCKSLGGEGANILNRIIENTEKMKELINMLLEFSRVGRIILHRENINLKKLLIEIFDDLTYSQPERNFDFSIDENIPDIFADRTLCRQMFENLLNNAVKFTMKKEVSEIKINFKSNDGSYIISIKDNGAGFDNQYKHKLFNVFHRLHNDEDFPGTGVGLSIVKKVAERHGWHVDAESSIDKGAKFSIIIPKEEVDNG